MRTGLVMLCAALTLGVVGLVLTAGDATSSAQDAWKARHAANVVAELEARDTGHLTPSQRAHRARLLDELSAYGKAGRFAQNEDFPGEAIPHLIDRHGTRCALANLIDVSGHGELLQRLARRNNIAFVPELKGDVGLSGWLDEHGLTIEEAAYIQGPGFTDPAWQDQDTNTPTPVDPGSPPDVTTPSAPTTGGRGRVVTGAGEATWDMWWRLNRHAFVNLRARYHDAVVTTGRKGDENGRRPDDEQIDKQVVPLLRKLASQGDDHIRSTALMAWARVAREQHGAEVVEALRTYLRDPDNGYRELMILALGVTRHPDALPVLCDILLDKKEGRSVLGQKERLTLHMRGYAAIALGQCGQAGAIEPLKKMLDVRKKKMADLKASAVMALGTLARDLEAAERDEVVAYLLKALKKGRWSDPVLAAIPTAIANAGAEETFVSTFQPIMERFRKPTWVRQSAILGLAMLGPKADDDLLDTLIAGARRDPDNNARRFAILGIGELARAQPPAPDEEDLKKGPRAKLGKRIHTYFRSAFDRRSVQKADLPWLVISASLFAHGYPEHAPFVKKQLVKHATKDGAKERQAAAVVALGLLGDRSVLPDLDKLYKRSKDKMVRGYLTETLGMLGDKSQRDRLLERLREDGDGQVRYRAALGLGFSADGAMLDPLLDELTTTGSAGARTALSRVVGELGDRRALPTLVEVAGDKKAGQWNRIRAIGTIGLIGQRSDHAWVTAFQRGVNFPQATPTVRVLFGLY